MAMKRRMNSSAKHTKKATLKSVNTALSSALMPQWSHANSAQLSTVRKEKSQKEAGEKMRRWQTRRRLYQAEEAGVVTAGAVGKGTSSSECIDQRDAAVLKVVLRRPMTVVVVEEVRSHDDRVVVVVAEVWWVGVMLRSLRLPPRPVSILCMPSSPSPPPLTLLTTPPPSPTGAGCMLDRLLGTKPLFSLVTPPPVLGVPDMDEKNVSPTFPPFLPPLPPPTLPSPPPPNPNGCVVDPLTPDPPPPPCFFACSFSYAFCLFCDLITAASCMTCAVSRSPTLAKAEEARGSSSMALAREGSVAALPPSPPTIPTPAPPAGLPFSADFFLALAIFFCSRLNSRILRCAWRTASFCSSSSLIFSCSSTFASSNLTLMTATTSSPPR